MLVKTLSGGEVDLGSADVEHLRLRLRGPLLEDGAPGYEEARTVWNAMIDRKPALVARCIGVTDVIESVRFAREHDLLICIKGGGHNVAGLAVADEAFMLDMSLMRGVWVDAPARIAHAQAGCLLGDVDRETQLHDQAAVLGIVSQTGIAGLTLGGGFGYLTRRQGWTADNVAGIDVVTADGRPMHASSSENADLFWGLRGGGGNFGVVTGFDYALYPVGPEVVGGIVAWPASEAEGVFEFFQRLTEKAPPELSLWLQMRPAAPAPWLPRERHGTPIVAIGCCYSGKVEDGEKLVAPIKSFGTPIGHSLRRQPYVSVQAMLDAAQPKGRRDYWKSEYLPGVGSDFAGRFIAHAARIDCPHTSMFLMHLAGALNAFPAEHSPVGNRDAHYVFLLLGSWEKREEDEENMAWAREAWSDLRRFSTGGVYLNFLSEDEGHERMEAALGKSLERLSEIKRKWDPDNVFRTNRNINPA